MKVEVADWARSLEVNADCQGRFRIDPVAPVEN
jgi:hypothetical protein